MIVNWSSLSLFAVAAAVLVFTPGPNTLYVIARSVQQGRVAGAVSSLGVQVGTFIHVLIAALGLSAFIVSSAVIFPMVKYAGAAYLIYLGIQTLWSKAGRAAGKVEANRSLREIFRQGVVVNLLNPKTALFFFAFLPQFIDPQQEPVALQILILGLILSVLGTTSDMLYALTAGTLGAWLGERGRMLAIQRYFASTVYIFLGLLAGLSGMPA